MKIIFTTLFTFYYNNFLRWIFNDLPEAIKILLRTLFYDSPHPWVLIIPVILALLVIFDNKSDEKNIKLNKKLSLTITLNFLKKLLKVLVLIYAIGYIEIHILGKFNIDYNLKVFISLCLCFILFPSIAFALRIWRKKQKN